jgi:hypothetical protein
LVDIEEFILQTLGSRVVVVRMFLEVSFDYFLEFMWERDGEVRGC